MYNVDDLNFKCIVCGEKIPTVFIKEIHRGDHYTGDHEVSVEYYDTSKNGYFVRLDNAEVLSNQYKSLIGGLQTKEKNKAKAEIDKVVSNEDFKKIVEERLFENIDKDYKSRLDGFDDFIYWFKKPFEKRLPQPRYAMTLPCTNSVLNNVNSLKKRKYVVELGKEKLLNFRARACINKFSKTFPFVSDFLGLDVIDKLTTKDNLIFEFGNFSEYPLK